MTEGVEGSGIKPKVNSPDDTAPRVGLRVVADKLGAAVNWALMRLVLVRVTFGEAEKRASLLHPDETNMKEDAFGAAVTTPFPEQAKFLFELQEKASEHTFEKTKQLLALSTSLAAIVAVFARELSPAESVALLLPLLAVVILCLRVFGVKHYAMPEPTDTTGDSGQVAWSKDLQESRQYNERGHNFRVEAYRAGMRWFLIAVTMLLVVSWQRAPTEGEIVRELRSIRMTMRDSIGLTDRLESSQAKSAIARIDSLEVRLKAVEAKVDKSEVDSRVVPGIAPTARRRCNRCSATRPS